VKKGHCRLCWLQAGITATGRRITPADFRSGGCRQLSFAGMSQLGHTSQQPAAGRPQPAAAPGGTQLELPIPGESLHSGKAHWVASAITNETLQQARHIAAELAGTRGWNPRIVAETGRALAVVLAGHIPGHMIAWSALPAALRSRDLSVTRTAEILGLAGLLHDDRAPSFAALVRQRLALLPPPIAADAGHWLRTRSQGGPRSRPRNEHTVRQNLNRSTPCCWNGPGAMTTCARSPPPTSSPPPGRCRQACAGRPPTPCAPCSGTARTPARSSPTPPAASAPASGHCDSSAVTRFLVLSWRDDP
jgi:hypothetical protein